MNINLNSEEIGILLDCCIAECANIGKYRDNKFVNQNDLELYADKVKAIMKKLGDVK